MPQSLVMHTTDKMTFKIAIECLRVTFLVFFTAVESNRLMGLHREYTISTNKCIQALSSNICVRLSALLDYVLSCERYKNKQKWI